LVAFKQSERSSGEGKKSLGKPFAIDFSTKARSLKYLAQKFNYSLIEKVKVKVVWPYKKWEGFNQI